MRGRWQGFRRSHKLSPSRPRASISAPQLAEMMRSRTAASDWSGDAATPILVKAAKSRTATILIQNEHRKWAIGSGSPPWNVAARLVPWLCLRFAWVSIAVGQQRHLLSKRGRGSFPPLLLGACAPETSECGSCLSRPTLLATWSLQRNILEAYGLRKPRLNCSRQMYARRFPNDGESLGLIPDYHPPCLLILIFSSSSSYVCPWTQLICSNRFQWALCVEIPRSGRLFCVRAMNIINSSGALTY
jgi:hypothetical protein